MTIESERVPKTDVNVTVSDGSGFPFRVTLALIVDVMVEPAPTIAGFAEMVKLPEETVIILV